MLVKKGSEHSRVQKKTIFANFVLNFSEMKK